MIPGRTLTVPAVLVLLALTGCGETMGEAIGPGVSDGGAGGVTVPESIRGLWTGKDGRVCACGDGALYLREPADKAWKTLGLSSKDLATLKGLRLLGVACPSAGQIVAVGSTTALPPAPRIALFTRAASWQLQTFQPDKKGELTALAVHGNNEYFAVGYRPVGKPGSGFRPWSITSADPSSGIWKEEQSLTGHQPLRDIWIRPDGQRVVVGDSGLLMQSSGKDKPLAVETNPLGAVAMRAAWAPDTSSFVAAGDSGALLIRQSSGTWRPMAGKKISGISWRAIHGSSSGNIIAVGRQDLAHHDGSNWRELKNITGLPATRDLRAIRMERGPGPSRLHLAGKGLLATCTVHKGAPPALTCGP